MEYLIFSGTVNYRATFLEHYLDRFLLLLVKENFHPTRLISREQLPPNPLTELIDRMI